MQGTVQTIGIIGAGKVGIVFAQLARKAGYTVLVAGSGSPNKIRLTVEVLAPGAQALSTHDVVARSDVIILALPLSAFKNLPVDALAGKLVIDSMNHWWEIDGPRASVLPDDHSSSVAVQHFLRDSRVVKALNHMGYHHLHDETRVKGMPDRKAIAIAGDTHEDTTTVAGIVENFGFDPLVIGSLTDGVRLEPGHPAFGANLTKEALEAITRS